MDLSKFSEVTQLRESLLATQRQLSKANDKHEALRDAMWGAVDAAIANQKRQRLTPAPVRDKRRGHAEVALWHSSDWQGSKKTPSYDSEVMRRRVMEFADRCEVITEIQRKHHPVQECFILFGGDMVEGLFQFPSQPFEIDMTLFEQWVTVSNLIADFVSRALQIYGKVTVVPEWGNHGRIGSKRSTVPRSDNFDRMCYEHAKRLLEKETRLTWQDCPEDIQRVEIGNYRALLIHGDEIGRNGFASPMTIVQHANKWRSGAYAWTFRDVFMGHYHTHAEWPMANGEGAVYQTGSTESDNRYAGVMLAGQAIPSQRLHFVDPERGRTTAQYKIWLT
jgi:hypothetical protein